MKLRKVDYGELDKDILEFIRKEIKSRPTGYLSIVCLFLLRQMKVDINSWIIYEIVAEATRRADINDKYYSAKDMFELRYRKELGRFKTNSKFKFLVEQENPFRRIERV